MNIKISNTDFLRIEKSRCGVKNVEIAERLGVENSYATYLFKHPQFLRLYQINILSVLFGWNDETTTEFIRDCVTER